MLSTAIKKVPKSSKYLRCEVCDYSTSRKSQYDRHILTPKHVNAINAAEDAIKSSEKVPLGHACDCGNSYNHYASLWRHRKNCTFQKEQKEKVLTTDASNNTISNEILLEFMKKDTEFKAVLMEAFKNGIGNTTNNNTNSHNKIKNKFNMNFFLNEQCKDAMNIMDFVNTMKLQLSDLERVGELGYVKGISHIVVNKLKDLDVHKRPIHCSDLKRETMYVKDEDIWEKETENKEKISKMITRVAHKNQIQIKEWQQENPEYKDSESVKSEKYLKIVGESMNGLTNDNESSGYTNKIIKNIAKEVVIEKEEE